jgi:hypothetical protein
MAWLHLRVKLELAFQASPALTLYLLVTEFTIRICVPGLISDVAHRWCFCLTCYPWATPTFARVVESDAELSD